MNKFKEINWNPDTKAIQAFARVLTIGIPFTGLAWFVIMWFVKDAWIVKVPVYIISIGWSIALVSYVVPSVIGIYFYKFWFFLICIIETVVTTLLFTIAYYLVITPFGFFLSISGKATMKSISDLKQKSYWKDAEKITDPKRYYRQF